MGQVLNELYQDNVALQYRNKALQREIHAYEDGSRYKKIQDDHRKIEAGYRREIKHLHKQLDESDATATNVLNIWYEQCQTDWESYQEELAKKDAEIRRLQDQIWTMIQEHDDKLANTIAKYNAIIAEKDALLAEKDLIIARLEERLTHEVALNQRNGLNTSLPTSQTKPGQTKVIPNGRKKSDKPKGGQKGHRKSKLDKPKEEDIKETVWHDIDGNSVCPDCGANDWYYTGKNQTKYEYDIEIKVIPRRHYFYQYMCGNCGKTMWWDMDPRFRGECTYGPTVQAVALSLMNTTNAAMNKVPLLLSGMTGGKIDPSEGYVAKLQKRAAKNLHDFYEDLRMHVVSKDLLYWDDTVIFINKERACFRFYGDKHVAFYTAHMHKDLESLKEDAVLTMLDECTKVMHDHNTVNYNPLFVFINLECDQHVERDAQKNTDDTGHKWSAEFKELIATTIKDRKEAKARLETSFSEEYIQKFNERLDEILALGWKEYEVDAERLKHYGAPSERALLKRIEKYRPNYFMWVTDFSLPTTNNLSERALRGIKTKMKVSGQFESEETAQNYAMIRSYLETCRRNDINEMEALRKLSEGNPYTLSEILDS